MITINNLTEGQQIIADLVWECGTPDQFDFLIRAMTPRQKAEVGAILKLIEWGGDTVEDLQQAQKELDRIQKL
jgi:hypothetical protein